MNNWIYRAPPLAAMAMTVILAAGCSSQASVTALSADTTAKPEVVNVTVAAIPTADLAGLYIAQDYGYFAQQGLHVTIEKIASSQAIITDQREGRVDISAGSYIPYIAAQAAGATFRILAEASTLQPRTRVLVIRGGSAITTIAGLIGKKIGVNGTNSIGTLLISALLAEHGYSPRKVDFVTESAGFPVMPGDLQSGQWDAAFLAEPYVTAAQEVYGEQVLADLDQGATAGFPVDGYVATQAWAKEYPRTAAAFVRAIDEGQNRAQTDRAAVQVAMAKSDNLPVAVTALMALPAYPTGPVDQTRIQRVAADMLEFGMLSQQYANVVDQGMLVKSMIR